jgi:hypothetical protein
VSKRQHDSSAYDLLAERLDDAYVTPSESTWMTTTEQRAFISVLSTELLRAETEER